jgi:hypothetical protein
MVYCVLCCVGQSKTDIPSPQVYAAPMETHKGKKNEVSQVVLSLFFFFFFFFFLVVPVGFFDNWEFPASRQ